MYYFFIHFFVSNLLEGQKKAKLKRKGDQYYAIAINLPSSVDSALHYLSLSEEKYMAASSWKDLIKIQVEIGDLYAKKKKVIEQ